MRRLLLALIVVGIASSVEAAPFTPLFGSFNVLDYRFDSTGTDTVCLNCADADPFNDFKAKLTGFYDSGFVAPNAVPYSAIIDLTGTTTSGFLGIFETITVDLRVEMVDPFNTAEYPYPSVSYGSITGTVESVQDFVDINLITTCCGGEINTLGFRSFYPPLLQPFDSESLFAAMEVHPPSGAEYTPAPEPTSLIMLGSGIAWAVARRRKMLSRR